MYVNEEGTLIHLEDDAEAPEGAQVFSAETGELEGDETGRKDLEDFQRLPETFQKFPKTSGHFPEVSGKFQEPVEKCPSACGKLPEALMNHR